MDTECVVATHELDVCAKLPSWQCQQSARGLADVCVPNVTATTRSAGARRRRPAHRAVVATAAVRHTSAERSWPCEVLQHTSDTSESQTETALDRTRGCCCGKITRQDCCCCCCCCCCCNSIFQHLSNVHSTTSRYARTPAAYTHTDVRTHAVT